MNSKRKKIKDDDAAERQINVPTETVGTREIQISSNYQLDKFQTDYDRILFGTLILGVWVLFLIRCM